MSPLRVRRPARSRQDQGGFALVTVLAVIAVTSLLIGALFGLMLTTMRVTAAQEREAREQRAADAAIETAINTMRTEPCSNATQPYLADQVYDQQTAGTGDDVHVDVTCSSVAGGDSVTDQVRIVGGDGYKGALSSGWTVDCAANASAPGCMPWAAALGSVPANLAASKSTLVHTGPEPLRFTAGVTVRTGAAALRNPVTGAPAIEVGGQYNQGAAGLLASSGTDCGMLSGTPGDGAGQVADMDDDPQCGVPAARAVDVQPTGGGPGLSAPTNTPVVPATCSADPVQVFTEGTYSAASTAAVSKLTDGSQPSCRGKTFHFLPGLYSFQGTELKFGDDTSYYVFGAADGGWGAGGVQSEATLVADADATLCAPDVSGTTLVLAGWTKLTHTGGRVAICPAWPAGAPNSSTAHPALYQNTTVPTEVQVVSVNTRPVQNGLGSLPFKCRAYTYYGGLSYGTTYPTERDYPPSSGTCRPIRTFELTLGTQGQAPVRSLRVMLTGTETTRNNLVTNRMTRFRLNGANGALLCQTDFVSGMPNGGLTSSFDLKTMPGGCATASLNQSQLDGAKLLVDHQMDLGNASVEQSYAFDNAQVEVNPANGLASTATSSSWNNPERVTGAPDSDSASPVMPCPDFVCQVADPGRTKTPATPFRHEMSVSDFSFDGLLNSSDPSIDPSLRSLRALIKVKPSSLTLPAAWTSTFGSWLSTQNFLLPTRSYLELRAPDGGRCIVQGEGMNSDQEIAFNLLAPALEDPAASGCNTFLFDRASDLADVTMNIRFELPCLPDYFHNVPWECMRSNLLYNAADTSPIWQLRPPDIESVRLTTVTDTYSSVETSRVTSNATGGASSASFNVYGRAWMPLADLDIDWKGPATEQPLFANDLVLHGLGSVMKAGAQMGAVCCSPEDTRTVELVATIDGVERLTARVEFSDVEVVGGVPVYRPGYGVDVLRWLTCRAEGCASVLAASDERANSPGP